jgi:hypothetical protein
MGFGFTYETAEPSQGQLVAGLSLRRIGFNSRPFSLGFVMGKALLRGHSLQVLQFFYCHHYSTKAAYSSLYIRYYKTPLTESVFIKYI